MYVAATLLNPCGNKISAGEFDECRHEAWRLGAEQNADIWQGIQTFSTEGFCEGSFDSESARSKLLAGEKDEGDVASFLSSSEHRENLMKNGQVDPDETIFLVAEQGENLDGDKVSIQGVDYSLKTCKKSAKPFNLIVNRSLVVETQVPEPVSVQVKVCTGHHYENRHRRSRDARSEASSKRAKLETNSEIVFLEFFADRKTTIGNWTHREDASSCDQFRMEERLYQPPAEITSEHWEYDSNVAYEALSSPNYTLAGYRCFDADSTKQIEGIDVHRKCWNEQLAFICRPEPVDSCEFLKALNCQFVARRCKEYAGKNCALWEKTFRCKSRGGKRSAVDLDEFELIDGQFPQEEDELQGKSLAEVVSKLSVLSQVQKELQDSYVNAGEAAIFSGQERSCTKNISGDVLYDCCFSLGGVATKVGLAHCNADELALADWRQQGLCRYIGKVKQKLAGMWHSSDRHVFVCFSTKLSRIIQEQARDQLGISWGNAENPNTRGLTAEEISKLDFSAMDLSELYEEISPKNTEELEHRLQNFSVRLEDIQKRMDQEMTGEES